MQPYWVHRQSWCLWLTWLCNRLGRNNKYRPDVMATAPPPKKYWDKEWLACGHKQQDLGPLLSSILPFRLKKYNFTMMMEQSVCAYYRVYPPKCLLQTGICHRADFCKNLREYHRENNPYLIKIGSASQRLCHFQCSKVCTHQPWLMRLSGNCLTLTLSNFFLFTLFNFVFFNKRYFSCVFYRLLIQLNALKNPWKILSGKIIRFLQVPPP